MNIDIHTWGYPTRMQLYPIWSIVIGREYSTYRVVTNGCLDAPRHLAVHENLKTFIKYSECSVQTL